MITLNCFSWARHYLSSLIESTIAFCVAHCSTNCRIAWNSHEKPDQCNPYNKINGFYLNKSDSVLRLVFIACRVHFVAFEFVIFFTRFWLFVNLKTVTSCRLEFHLKTPQTWSIILQKAYKRRRSVSVHYHSLVSVSSFGQHYNNFN